MRNLQVVSLSIMSAIWLIIAGLACVVSGEAVKPLEYFASSSINASYVNWFEERGVELFDTSAFLPSPSSDDEGVAVHWIIDDASATIRLAVAAPASGWVGFGIAEAGGMPGSDIVLYEAATDSVTDAYVGSSYVAPTPDVSQDWTLLYSQVEDGFIVFEASRSLDTGDPQDRIIGFDGKVLIPPHRVIAAWGDSTSFSYHGKKRTRSALRFYPIHSHVGREEDIFADEMAESSEGYIDLIIDNHAISIEDTEYVDLCISYQDLIDRGMPTDVPLHIIGFQPIVDSAKHLHHLVMFGSSSQGEVNNCDQQAVAFQGGLSLTWGYAPGAVPWELPEEAGIAFGSGAGAYTMFYLNYHYDNRWKDEGVTDSSGVRIYYTSQKREYDAGILQLGDPIIQLAGEPIGQGLMRHDFDCPSSCTSFSFKEEVTVYKEVLHMHEVGVTMSNEVIRDGEVMRKATVEYFDFEQAGLHEVQQDTFTIKPGDSIRSSCFFNTTESKGPVKYGYGSQDEMCVSYMHYYPKQDLPLGLCGADWFFPACSATHTVEPINEVERVFGVLPLPDIDGPDDEDDNSEVTTSPSQDTSFAHQQTTCMQMEVAVVMAVLALIVM